MPPIGGLFKAHMAYPVDRAALPSIRAANSGESGAAGQ